MVESEERLMAYNWQMGRTCETVKGKRNEGKEITHVSEADLTARRGLKRAGGRRSGARRRGL